MQIPLHIKTVVGILIGASVVLGIGAGALIKLEAPLLPSGWTQIFSLPAGPGGDQPGGGDAKENKAVKFASEEEFLAYLNKGREAGEFGFATQQALPSPMMGREAEFGAPLAADGKGGGGGGGSRVSLTNVQVTGVDEPDVVKTDGKQIYFARSNYDRYIPMMEEQMTEEPIQSDEFAPSIYPSPYRDSRAVEVLKAFPPAELGKLGKIEKYGNLLLHKNILIVFTDDNRAVYGFDVSDASLPEEKWKVEMEDNTYVVSARLFADRIYLVTGTGVNYTDPCPIIPFRLQGDAFSIPCVNIYHPRVAFPVDSTYTASAVDPQTGAVKNSVSFVGSSGSSVVYMSKNAIYISYSYPGDIFGFLVDFLKTKTADLFPADLIARLQKIRGYEISAQSKLTEFMIETEKFMNSKGQDEQTRIENELENRMEDYAKQYARELARTGIAKIHLDDLSVTATGSVPGMLLNQFSLDEYDGYLRAATTVGGNGLWGFGGEAESANDVYVLDRNLEISGMVKDLGITERIYSVRFIEDRGYVVTFRQIDPFYVLDLSDPKKPKLAGELKIPGFSSYLDPIAENRVVGVGQEGSQVKISLFDVSDSASPKEADKYLMKEYWSDVSNTHHAFLADPKHTVFFLPAGQSGYVFSYKDDELKLERVVSNITARRALYINDYLYVIGEDRIVVLNERDWEKVNELKF